MEQDKKGSSLKENTYSNFEKSVLKAQIVDYENALEVFSHHGWPFIKKHFDKILSGYENVLNNPSVDPQSRDRACWAVAASKRFCSIQEELEKKKRFAEKRLSEVELRSKERPIDRIFTFFR